MAPVVKDGTPKSVAVGTKAKKQPQSVQGRAQGNTYENIPTGPGFGQLGSLFAINLMALEQDGIVPWSWYPLYRDRQLRLLARKEGIMAGAIYSIQARMRALPWTVSGRPRAKSYFQTILGDADEGNGWPDFIGSIIQDLLTQDNGAFIELVGGGEPDAPMRGPIVQVNQLDSGLCWRTHDPEYPVIYTNPFTGMYHAMHNTRIISMASQRSPQELARGIGFCGVSRVQRNIQTSLAIETYKDEKISGRFRRGIIFGHGFTSKQLGEAAKESDEADDSEGLTSYRRIMALLSMQPDADLKMLDLASLPDGFDYKEDLLTYVYMVANAFGTDAREFWSATTSGATKADAETQHAKSQGKGIADLIQTIEHAFNWGPLRDVAEVTFDNVDMAMKLEQAKYHQVVIQNVQVMEQSGNITPAEGRAILIAEEVIDVDVLASAVNPVTATESAPLTPSGNTVINEDQQDPGPANDAANADVKQPASQQANDTASEAATDSSPVAPTSAAQPKKKVATAATKASAAATKEAAPATFDRLKQRSLEAGRREHHTHDHQHGDKAKKKQPIDPRVLDLIDRVNNYQDDLGAIYNDYLDDLRTMSDQKAAANLRQAYINAMEDGLTTAYGVGLDGAEVPKTAEKTLRKIASTSLDYFDTSYMPDLSDAAQIWLEEGIDLSPTSFFEARLKGYAGAWWQSLWAGQGDAADEDAIEVDGEMKAPRVERRLDPAAQHCETCPDKAGIYESFDDMDDEAGIPGDGSDDCFGNCRCTIWVESKYGEGDFAPPSGTPTIIIGGLFSVD